MGQPFFLGAIPIIWSTTVLHNYYFSFVGSFVLCPLLSLLIVREVFRDTSLLAHTHTGYNALCGCCHAKVYYKEDGIFTNFIRHLRSFGSSMNFNDMVYTICTN